ncbi:MAG TPA: GIY-YIG nuclease family protein [Duganella sp.]|nr:GIY-YIG nuclease family protein [Duganella sp.]
MSLLDILALHLSAAIADAEKSAPPRSSSAIGPGRMRQTDIVKGPNSPLPATAGVYRHINKETKAIEYVGQTNDLRKRQQEHLRSGKLDTNRQNVHYSAARSGVDKAALCATEVKHIERHKPSGNTTKGGNGRR